MVDNQCMYIYIDISIYICVWMLGAQMISRIGGIDLCTLFFVEEKQNAREHVC